MKNKKDMKNNTGVKASRRGLKKLPLYLRIIIIVLASLIVIGGLGAGALFFYIKHVNGVINADAGAVSTDFLTPVESPEEPVTVLVLGRDTRDAENEAGRADIIMLLYLDPEKDSCTLLSIPRDCLVEIPGYGEDKINAAYAYGREELMIETVNSFLGAEINHYVTLDFDGFVELIDAMDGVDITLEVPTEDPKTGANFSAGNHHFTGEQALSYIRSRSTELGDIGRIQRQQQLFKEIIKQKLSFRYLKSIPYYFNILEENTRTDIDVLTLLKYSNAVLSFNSDNFETVIVPSRSGWIRDNTISVQIPDAEEARAMWQRVINGEPVSRYNAEYSEVDKIPASMTQNTMYKFKIRVKNKGALDWNQDSENPVYLGYHWIDLDSGEIVVYDGRRSIIPQSGVATGDEVIFDLAVVSPSEAGNYILQVDLVHEGVTWFSIQGVPMLERNILIDVSYGAEYDDGGETPEYLEPGEEFEVTVKVKNSGFMMWESTGKERMDLGAHWIDRDTEEAVIWDGERGLLPSDVSHGEEAEIEMTIKAPDKPGNYTLQYDMAHERVTWFSDRGIIPLEVDIDVGRPVDKTIAGKTTVKLFNGNGVPGAAGEIEEYLESYGFKIYSLSNAEGFDFEESIIIYNEGCDEKAEELSLAFDNLKIYEYNKTWNFYRTDADLIVDPLPVFRLDAFELPHSTPYLTVRKRSRREPPAGSSPVRGFAPLPG
ncbi:MAG: LCP family protein [Actinomycetota bacterium]|nr:LCP family protein [Actinomycetota bacterium]